MVAQIRSENQGASIDAFERYWQGVGGGGGHLAEAQEAASLAADCLEAFAAVIEGLKAAVIAQLIIFVAEFTADQLAAPETLGLSEGAAAAQVVTTRSILRALIDDGVKETTRLVLQHLRERAGEIFAKMLRRALVTGAVATGLDFARQEYEINVLHTRQGLSVGELAAAGGTGATIGVASTLFHMRLREKLRQSYFDEVKGLAALRDEMRAAGASAEEIARAVNQARRDIGVKYKDLTPPDLLERIYKRNFKRYGDPLGPTVDWLRAEGKSWEDIIESALRPGGKDLGL